MSPHTGEFSERVKKWTNPIGGYKTRLLKLNFDSKEISYARPASLDTPQSIFAFSRITNIGSTHENEFTVVLGRKTWYFKTSSRSDRDAWVQRLNKAKDLGNSDTNEGDIEQNQIEQNQHQNVQDQPTLQVPGRDDAASIHSSDDDVGLSDLDEEEGVPDSQEMLSKSKRKSKFSLTRRKTNDSMASSSSSVQQRASSVSSTQVTDLSQPLRCKKLTIQPRPFYSEEQVLKMNRRMGVELAVTLNDSQLKLLTYLIASILGLFSSFFVSSFLNTIPINLTFMSTNTDGNSTLVQPFNDEDMTSLQYVYTCLFPQTNLISSTVWQVLAAYLVGLLGDEDSFIREYWWLVLGGGIVLIVSGISMISPLIQPILQRLQSGQKRLRTFVWLVFAGIFLVDACIYLSSSPISPFFAWWNIMAFCSSVARALHLSRVLSDPRATARMIGSIACASAGIFLLKLGMVGVGPSSHHKTTASLMFVTAVGLLLLALAFVNKRVIEMLSHLLENVSHQKLKGFSLCFLGLLLSFVSTLGYGFIYVGSAAIMNFMIEKPIAKRIQKPIAIISQYISISPPRKELLAAVLIFFLTFRMIPSRLKVMHACTSYGCVISSFITFCAFAPFPIFSFIGILYFGAMTITIQPRLRVYLRQVWRQIGETIARAVGGTLGFTSGIVLLLLSLRDAAIFTQVQYLDVPSFIVFARLILEIVGCHTSFHLGCLCFTQTVSFVREKWIPLVYGHEVLWSIYFLVTAVYSSITLMQWAPLQIFEASIGYVSLGIGLYELRHQHPKLYKIHRLYAVLSERMIKLGYKILPFVRVIVTGFMTLRFAYALRLVSGFQVGIIAFALASYTSGVICFYMVALALKKEAWKTKAAQLYAHLDLRIYWLLKLIIKTPFLFLAKAFNMLRNFSNSIGKLFSTLWTKILRPFSLAVRRFFIAIWNSPVIPFFLALSTLVIAYMVHSGKLQVPDFKAYSPDKYFTSALDSLETYYESIKTTLIELRHSDTNVGHVLRASIQSMKFSASEFGSWYSILSSSGQQMSKLSLFDKASFAWAFYLINLGLGHFEVHQHFKVKLAVVPISILVYTSYMTPSYFGTGVAFSLLWLVLALTVEYREAPQRRAARQQFENFLRGRRAQTVDDVQVELPPSSNSLVDTLAAAPKPSVVYETEDCIICLDPMNQPDSSSETEGSSLNNDENEGGDDEDAASKCKDVVYTPCGHCFHKDCLASWFNTSRNYRCPVCQQSCDRYGTAVQTIF